MYYDSLEREALAQSGHFGLIKVPRVIAFEGNELFFEFIEGKLLREELSETPFNERQENLFMTFSGLVIQLKSELDNKPDRLDGSRSLEVWSYQAPEIARQTDLFGDIKSQPEASGGFVLLDTHRKDQQVTSYAEEGYAIMSLSPMSIIVSKSGGWYYSEGFSESLQFSRTVGADPNL